MKVVVTGATGNVGTATLEALQASDDVDEIIGIARRRPTACNLDDVRWVACDVSTDPLDEFAGADAVIHLAWLIQPVRNETLLRKVNVVGTRRVLDAAIRHGVPTLVVASSVGAYSAGPKDERVNESWPTGGIATSLYSRQKAEVEAILDETEQNTPGLAVIRMRTALVFSARAATEIKALFLGPFLPSVLVGQRRLPFVPSNDRLVFQVVSSADVGDAYCRAALDGRPGAYNVAAEPVLSSSDLADIFDAHTISVPSAVLRHAAGLTHALRLQPTSQGWVDLALGVPTMDTTLATCQLGWTPRVDARTVVTDLLNGFARRTGADTPPLAAPPNGETIHIGHRDMNGNE